jgi:hypothetical protein
MNRLHRDTNRVAASFLAAALAITGASAQTKIKSGFNIFSTEQDVEIGRQSAAQVEQQLPMIEDRRVVAYVHAVGQRLAAAMPGSKFNYQFKVVDASDVNAFALPGGFMYVNRGLIEAAKNEGQLAGVLAHEMAHVALRHGTNQASKAYLGQTASACSADSVQGGQRVVRQDRRSRRGLRPQRALPEVLAHRRGAGGRGGRADVGARRVRPAGHGRLLRDAAQPSIAQPEQGRAVLQQPPAPANRAARIRSEMKMLTIRPTAAVGGFSQARSTLAAMPAARSMQQLTASGGQSTGTTSQPPTRTYPGGTIEEPATTYSAFQSRAGLYRIDYPTNWRPYEAADGTGVTIAPEGGVVDAGGLTSDLVYGVVINHYAPFLDDPDESLGRFSFSFQGAPGMSGSSSSNVSRTNLANATNDLINQIMRTNRTLKVVPDSQRTDTIDGAPALSVVLSGRSSVTGQDERVTVFTRELHDEHVVYALFIAPGGDYAALRPTFNRMISSLNVNDSARHP